MIQFSIANKVNISIDTSSISENEKKFVNRIYENFSPAVSDPLLNLYVNITDQVPEHEPTLKLGKDAEYLEGFVKLSSGHTYRREGRDLFVTIPLLVKRGRIPFKRKTPGRHITDEVIEPLIVALSPELGLRFYHASSYAVGGKAKVLLAWRSTGKTQSILPKILDQDVISDDLTVLDENGTVHKYPRPIRVYSYNIEDLPYDQARKAEFKRKSRMTPKWQPVEYLPLAPNSESYPLCNVTFLNNKNELPENIDRIANIITKFEYAYFEPTKQILSLAGIIK
jgi:hypothetical protein